jgi:hypothetical protein
VISTPSVIRIETIQIPANTQHEGFYSLKVSVPWYCIFCGTERGEPTHQLSYDGSRRMTVTGWTNPCGHIETYESIRQWLKFRDELGAAL